MPAGMQTHIGGPVRPPEDPAAKLHKETLGTMKGFMPEGGFYEFYDQDKMDAYYKHLQEGYPDFTRQIRETYGGATTRGLGQLGQQQAGIGGTRGGPAAWQRQQYTAGMTGQMTDAVNKAQAEAWQRQLMGMQGYQRMALDWFQGGLGGAGLYAQTAKDRPGSWEEYLRKMMGMFGGMGGGNQPLMGGIGIKPQAQPQPQPGGGGGAGGGTDPWGADRDFFAHEEERSAEEEKKRRAAAAGYPGADYTYG